jgi:hypothetical protein
MGRAHVYGAGTGDMVYFRQYSNLRSFSASGNLTLEIPFNRVTPFVKISQVETRQPEGYEIDNRIHRLSRTATAGATVRLAGKTSLQIAAYGNDISFDKTAVFRGFDLRTLMNERARGVQGSLRYQLTPLTTCVVQAERTREQFEFSPYRNSDTFRLAPGVEFGKLALVSGSAYVGYRRFNIANRDIQDFTGLVAAVDLRYTLLGRTRFSVGGDRDVAYSYDAVQPYYVISGSSGGITQSLTSAWDIAVNVNRHRLEYQSLGHRPGVRVRREIASFYRVEMGYRVGRQVRYSVRVDYLQRQTPADRELDYAGFRFGTSVTYGF